MKKILAAALLISSTQLFASQLSGSLNIQMGHPEQRTSSYRESKQRYGTSQRSSRYKKSMAPSVKNRFRRQKDAELQRTARDIRRTRQTLNQKRQALKKRRIEVRRLEKEVQDYQYDLRFYSDKERCIKNSRNQNSFNRCMRQYR